MNRVELLIREYETITTQIVHWDKFFWQKSQFFLAIESVLLAIVVQRLASDLIDDKPMPEILFWAFVAITLFNLYLCYVWFRTNRSNREYLNVRFERALQIENDPDMGGALGVFRLQRTVLRNPTYAKHSSSLWEIHLPTVFMVAWSVSIFVASCDSNLQLMACLVVILFLICVTVVELTGWPRPLRTQALPPVNDES